MKTHLRLPLFLLLALALLFAQQGAALHALSHLAEPQPTQSQQDKHLPHSQACDKCVAYAGVGSAVTASDLLPAPFTGIAEHLQATPAAYQPQPVLNFQSRAPPFFA